jgi:RES domain-containing protein
MVSTPEPPFLTVDRRFWRVLAPRWAHQPLSGDGAARNGGRWNPKGIPALYLSADLTTAVAEYEQDVGIRPGTFCAYDVKVDRVFDLTSAAVLGSLGIDPADRHVPWKTILLVERRLPPGWRIAENLIGLGANGVLVPSARPVGGTNLVLWRWNDAPERVVVALDPQTDRPRDQLSWR